jgi:hypothetical protein
MAAELIASIASPEQGRMIDRDCERAEVDVNATSAGAHFRGGRGSPRGTIDRCDGPQAEGIRHFIRVQSTK